MATNVYLIGFSGTGKSAVGASLARRLGWEHLDADDELVRRFGKTIERVFAEDGEAAFRAAERDVVTWTARQSRLVVSLGGGAVLDPTSQGAILRHRVVRLAASPEMILRRLAADETEIRPLLAASDPLGRIRELLARREVVYRMAEMTVDTDKMTLEEVVEWIFGWLRAVESGTVESGHDRSSNAEGRDDSPTDTQASG